MADSEALQRLQERLRHLEAELRDLRVLVVKKYGKPLWKVEAATPADLERMYREMVREAGAAARAEKCADDAGPRKQGRGRRSRRSTLDEAS